MSDLFDNLPIQTKSGWVITLRGPYGMTLRWSHRSGAVVRHCGHPTAIYPYYVEGMDGTFWHLADAKAAALAAQEAT